MRNFTLKVGSKFNLSCHSVLLFPFLIIDLVSIYSRLTISTN